MSKIIKIDSCQECPYLRIRSPEHFISEHAYCTAPGGMSVYNYEILPDWCPLPDNVSPDDIVNIRNYIKSCIIGLETMFKKISKEG